MARNFQVGATESITTTIGALGFVNPLTVLAAVRLNSFTVGPGGGLTIFEAGTVTANAWNLHVNNAGVVRCWWGSGSAIPAPTIVIQIGEWALVGASKATGTVVTRFYKYEYGSGAWTLENSSGAQANPGTPATSNIIGNNNGTDYWDGDIAIVGVWNVVLSDADVQKLAPTLDSNDWLTLPGTVAKGVWRLNQSVAATVTDLTVGGANQSAITGTRPSLDPAVSVVRNPDITQFPRSNDVLDASASVIRNPDFSSFPPRFNGV